VLNPISRQLQKYQKTSTITHRTTQPLSLTVNTSILTPINNSTIENRPATSLQTSKAKGLKSLQIEIPEEATNYTAPPKTIRKLEKSKMTPRKLDSHTPLSEEKKAQISRKETSTEKPQPTAKTLQQQLQMMAEMPLQPAHKIIIPNHEPTKCSVKRNGMVVAYAANTNQGIIRSYNEDRVSIILNILKPPNRAQEEWPKCSFFGIYDGHGGSGCADFLRDNLHQFVIKEASFPWNPKEAMRNGF
jgi:hypothetical protein